MSSTNVEDWVKFCDRYIDAAEVSCGDGIDEFVFEDCNLAVEGVIKACFASIGDVPEDQHNTVILLRNLDVNGISEEQEEFVYDLHSFYYRFHHGHDLSASLDITCSEAINKTKEFKSDMFEEFNISI